MALCDILICLDATAAGDGRLELALNLAQTNKAHLTAVYALPEFHESAIPPVGVASADGSRAGFARGRQGHRRAAAKRDLAGAGLARR
jgi:hypothetical protein